MGMVVAIAEDNTTLRSVRRTEQTQRRREFTAHSKDKKRNEKSKEVLKQETDTAIYLEKDNKIMTVNYVKGEKRSRSVCVWGGGGGI